jgi:hypothetical protein
MFTPLLRSISFISTRDHSTADLIRTTELHCVEMWCSLFQSLIRNLPVSQDSSPLLAILGKTIQPHFSLFLELAASKDPQIAILFLPLIIDISSMLLYFDYL